LKQGVDIHVGALFRVIGLMLLAGVVLPWIIAIWVDYPALEVSLFCLGFTLGLLFGAWKVIEAFAHGLQRMDKHGQEQDQE